eukprot:760121-Hanusia_phi.AAC.2
MEVANSDESPERVRFLVELEFVQCLASPHYLDWLASQGYLRDPKFIRYLDYLQYWKQPQYSKYEAQSLAASVHEEVRTVLTNDRTICLKITDQQFYHWLHRRRHIVEPEATEAEISEAVGGGAAEAASADKA